MSSSKLSITLPEHARGFRQRAGYSGDLDIPCSYVELTDFTPGAAVLRLAQTCVEGVATEGQARIAQSAMLRQLRQVLSPEAGSKGPVSVTIAREMSELLGRAVLPVAQEATASLPPTGSLLTSEMTKRVGLILPLVQVARMAVTAHFNESEAVADFASPRTEDPSQLPGELSELEYRLDRLQGQGVL